MEKNDLIKLISSFALKKGQKYEVHTGDIWINKSKWKKIIQEVGNKHG